MDNSPTNPLLGVNFYNKWESSWDQTLQNLFQRYTNDFDVIASNMNLSFQTSAFTAQNCQNRWAELRQKDSSEQDSSTREKIDRLMKLSAPPYEDPRKKMTLQELEETLPATRKNKDFLDPSFLEFDKGVDETITGEKIKPSGKQRSRINKLNFEIGFNILKDRIRPPEEERKKMEEEFLKSLENMTSDFTTEDNENPFM